MRKHSMMISSIGLMSTRSPYLVQLETYISPGLPYFSVIGLEDKDRRIRERIQAACATVGYQWPACRTTMNLMPASMPKQPELCVLACAASVLAADGKIPPERLMSTIIIGDVNEDGAIPPIEEDLTGFITHARELGIRHAIIAIGEPCGNDQSHRHRSHRREPNQRAAGPVTADTSAVHRSLRRTAVFDTSGKKLEYDTPSQTKGRRMGERILHRLNDDPGEGDDLLWGHARLPWPDPSTPDDGLYHRVDSPEL